MSKHVRILDKYDAEVIEEKYNKLIGRRELTLRLIHLGEGTPSRGLLKIGIGKLYNKEPTLVYIRRIESKYGLSETVVEAHVYDSVERAKLFEPEYVVKRDEESFKKISATQ
ncbi:MAG: 30S ribosomal protein S24e [Desulfurococcaceae archaeon]